jgi:hypothetical protein
MAVPVTIRYQSSNDHVPDFGSICLLVDLG